MEDKHSQELEFLLAARDAELEQARTNLAAVQAQAAVLQAQAAASDHRLAEASAAIQERDRRISSMEASAGWRLSLLGNRVDAYAAEDHRICRSAAPAEVAAQPTGAALSLAAPLFLVTPPAHTDG